LQDLKITDHEKTIVGERQTADTGLVYTVSRHVLVYVSAFAGMRPFFALIHGGMARLS